MKRKINPLVLTMITSMLSPIFFKFFDAPDKTTTQYIWVHYDRDGATVLSAGMINDLTKTKKDVSCDERK